MQYMGGKARIAREVSEVMLAARGSQSHYLEPFLGACNVLPHMAPHFDRSTGCDVLPDLVMLWQDAMAGWTPPDTLGRDEYERLRNAEPSALRAFAGFGCSFGGKWWGGYAHARSNHPTSTYAGSASRGVVRKAATLDPDRVTIALRDYTENTPGAETLVYCDPPYAGTTTYAGAGSWDAEAFWTRAREWVANGALVFVSEYAAPDDWQTAWQDRRHVNLAARRDARPVIERLYVHESQAVLVPADLHTV